MKKLISKSICLLLVFILSATPALSDIDLKNSYDLGIKLYKQGMYTESESAFSQSVGYNARLGQALSAYHLKQPRKALSLFKQSVLLANNDDERYKSLFNAATCSFVMGEYHSAAELFIDAEKYHPRDKDALHFSKISDHLARIVLDQLARDKSPSSKKKSSEGKKSISALEFVFDEEINLRIEDSDSTDSETSHQELLSLSDTKLLDSLIAAGIQSVKINDDGKNEELPSFIDLEIVHEFSNIESASYTSPASISDLWKRIFELEAGFPASLQQPETAPGIRPW